MMSAISPTKPVLGSTPPPLTSVQMSFMDAPPRAAIRGYPWYEVTQLLDSGRPEPCDQSIPPNARADSRVTRSESALKDLCEGKNEVSTGGPFRTVKTSR